MAADVLTVELLLVQPFEGIIEKTNPILRRSENSPEPASTQAEDSLISACRSLSRTSHRSIEQIRALIRRRGEIEGEISQLLHVINTNDGFNTRQRELDRLVVLEVDDYMEPGNFDPDFFGRLKDATTNFALDAIDIVRRSEGRQTAASLPSLDTVPLPIPPRDLPLLNPPAPPVTDASFVYQRLSPGMATRFIYLHRRGLAARSEATPGNETDGTPASIEIYMEEGSLNDLVAYDAISYTWDGQVPDQPILCNGKTMLVTRNCHRILSCVIEEEAAERARDGPPRARGLWIDAICIDQSFVEERNYQVSLMSEIFRNAQRVLVWPGECDQLTRDILGVLEQAALDHGRAEEFRTLDEEWTRRHAHNETDAFLNHFPNHFFRRSWFTRMWTMQETIMPAERRNIKFLIGSGTLSFVAVVEAARLHAPGRPEEANNALLLELYRQLVHRDPGGPRTPGLNELFADVRRKTCSEPKDKIFALHGLLETIDPHYPPPDYRRDVVDIFVEAAVWVMVEQGDLRMLYYSFKMQHELRLSQLSHPDQRRLPSWAPDFTLPQNRACKAAHNTIIRHGTTRESQAVCRLVAGPRNDGTQASMLLRIRGHFSSVVESCSPHRLPKFRTFYNDQRQFLVQACETWIQWFTLLAPLTAEAGVEMVELAVNDFAEHWVPRVETEYVSEFVRAIEEAYRYRSTESPARIAGQDWGRIDADAGGAPMFLTRPQGWDRLAMTRQHWMLMCQELEDFSCLITDEGQIGFGFGDIRPGDRTTLVSGLDLILFLRASGNAWKIVGMGYVFGLMDGGVWPDNESELEDIDLI